MLERHETDIRLFLCGDVMTGRGVDQILPHPCKPELHESLMKSALGYVELAEQRSGPIPRPVDFDYVWGDALELWREARPDLRIVNLETSVTRSDRAVFKGINYRMCPENVPVLTAAGVDCCTLANNHVMDWGRAGLLETLDTLRQARIATTGAGRDLSEARTPAVLDLSGKGRVLVYSLAVESSGVPRDWAAGPDRPGLQFTDLSTTAAEVLAEDIARMRRPGDIVVVAIHWGPNWGYAIPDRHRAFAHVLIDVAGVSIVHGHSSHHPLGVEVHGHGRGLVLYGCGDFLNDYEGIGGHEAYQSDVVLGFLADLDPTSGKLTALQATPLKISRLRLNRPSADDVRDALEVMNRECAQFGVRAEPAGEVFSFSWA